MPQHAIASLSIDDTLPRICVGLLTLLFFGLSMAITAVRLGTARLFGAPDDPASLLTKLVRAQGNTAEYVGLLAALMLFAGSSARPAWADAMMVLAVPARTLFAVGMLTSASLATPNLVRAAGACGTYVAGIGLGIAVLVS